MSNSRCNLLIVIFQHHFVTVLVAVIIMHNFNEVISRIGIFGARIANVSKVVNSLDAGTLIDQFSSG